MNGFTKADLLTFEKLLAPRVMKIVYFIGLLGIALGGLVMFTGSFAAMRRSALAGLGTMFVAVIGTVLAALLWRISCEVSIAFFNVHDRVGELRDRVGSLGTGAPSTGIGRHVGSVAHMIMLLGMTLLASACGGTRASLAKTIDEGLRKEQVCYSHGDMGKAPTWPLRVRRPMQLLGSGDMHPVLAAMQAAGQIKVTPTQVQNGWLPETADVIVPTEDARKWWNNDTGWCVGTKAVAEVREWTPPEGEVLHVSYTWKLVDVPSWARDKAFDALEGMSSPAKAEVIVQQTSNGWKVAF